MHPYTLNLDRLQRSVPFKKFVQLVKELPNMPFTDGYVFNDSHEITLENGIDTTVPGGDSSYHARDIGMTELVWLTDWGFQAPSDNRGGELLQFYFMQRVQVNRGCNTLQGIAKFQAEDPRRMLVEYGGDDEIVGNTAIFLASEANFVTAYALNHFEDPEKISDGLAPNSLLIPEGQNIHFPGITLDKHGSYITSETFTLLVPRPVCWGW